MSRLYSRTWSKARAHFLAQHPYCVLCQEMGRLMRATVVDHVKPHRGDPHLFWDEKNWQPLCKLCHDATKKSLELTGSLRGTAVDGWPLDRNHYWNR